MRLRNIGWLVCAGTSLTALPVSLRFSSVASPPSLFALVRRFPHALSTHRLNLPPSLSFTLALSLSLLCHLRFHLSPPFSPLSTLNPLSRSLPPRPLPPTRNTYTREPWSALYTRAHVLTYIRLQGFCSWRPILSDNEDDPFSSRRGQKGEGADGRGDTILPSCRGRDIFSLSRDNLETGVALPARESSEGARVSGPGQNAHPLSSLFTPFSRPLTLSRSSFLSLSHSFLLKVEGSSRLLRDFSPRKITGKPFLSFLV